MGREVRRVPENWQHPKDERGDFMPLFEWCDGEEYGKDEMMPRWTADQATHLMMYENTSEGTPISPGFETAEELARWLADNGVSAFADRTASYEQWLCTIKAGSACSMVFDAERGFRSGVEAACKDDKRGLRG